MSSLGDAFVESTTAPAREVFVDVYAHGSKESNWELGEKLGLSDMAVRYFAYTACEVKLTYKLDRETGETELYAVDGRKLEAA